MDLNKIVQKMRKRWLKLWSLSDLDKYLEGQKTISKNGSYKLAHRLVSNGTLISIRKGMYLWNVDTKLDPEDFYWPLVKKVIAENYLGQGILSGPKALALWIRDYSLMDSIQIIVPKNPKSLSIQGDYRLVSIALIEGKRSLYSLIKQYATRQSIDGTEFLVTAPEHALLESLTTRPGQDITDTSIVLRWLKKNAASLREDVFAALIPHRYISATNRLKYLSHDHGMNDVYEMMIRLIDRYGKWCHLSREFLLGKNSLKWKMKN